MARALLDADRTLPAEYSIDGAVDAVTFPSFEIGVEVAAGIGDDLSVDSLPELDLNNFVKGQPYRGWQQAVHEAYSFDSQWEARLAHMLDAADSVEWWLRNFPRRLRVATPIGVTSPDFVMAIEDGSLLLVEVKGDVFWEPPDSDARQRAAALQAWTVQHSLVSGTAWSAHTALESDVRTSDSWAQLSLRLVPPVP